MKIIEKIFDLIKYVIDASKLTIKKIKVIFFLSYMGIFTFNYLVDFSRNNGQISFKLTPGNVPTSVIILTACLIVFLVILDMIDHFVKSQNFKFLITSDKIPTALKEKALDEFIKLK